MPQSLYSMTKDNITRTARLLLLPFGEVIKWMKRKINQCLRFLKMQKLKLYGKKKTEPMSEEDREFADSVDKAQEYTVSTLCASNISWIFDSEWNPSKYIGSVPVFHRISAHFHVDQLPERIRLAQVYNSLLITPF